MFIAPWKHKSKQVAGMNMEKYIFHMWRADPKREGVNTRL